MAATHTDIDRVRSYGVVIDGATEHLDSEPFERRNPGTGELVARFARADEHVTQRGIDAARRAFDEGEWPTISGQARSRVLSTLATLMRRDHEKLARIEAEETGKPISTARGDVEGSIGLVEYAAACALTTHGDVHTNLGPGFTGLVTREPCGVVAMVTPWNFPLLLLMQKLPFALAAGCTAVCKPSELTAGTTLEVASLLEEARLPSGVFNVVTGPGRVVGELLARSPEVDFLSFTGSTAVGESIVAASSGTLKRLSLELGGKAASIVFPDADLEKAADGVLFAVTFNSGECCVSGARLLVHEDIADEFVAVLGRKAAELHVGAPLDEEATVGAMIHEQHLDGVLGFVAGAREDGATVVSGGERLTEGAFGDGF